MSTATERLFSPEIAAGLAPQLDSDSTPSNERFYTPEDLLSMPDGDQYELVDGKLVERSMGTLAGEVEVKLTVLLYNFTTARQLGRVLSSAMGYRCFPNNRVRKPDVSFILANRLLNNQLPRGLITVVPDLAVEVVSPTDIQYDVDGKVADYIEAGVKLVWVINPETRVVIIYHADGSIGIAREGGELDGEVAVPGFRCAVADLFVP